MGIKAGEGFAVVGVARIQGQAGHSGVFIGCHQGTAGVLGLHQHVAEGVALELGQWQDGGLGGDPTGGARVGVWGEDPDDESDNLN